MSALDDIATVRAENLPHWHEIENIVWRNYSPKMVIDSRDRRMSLLKHAFEIDPVKVKRILKTINENDRKISESVEKLINE